MENLSFALGVSINSPSRKLLKLFKKIDYTTDEENIFFAYNPSDSKFYKKLVKKKIEAFFRLGIFDNENEDFYEQPELTELFAKEADVSVDELNLEYLLDLGDFIDEHQAEIDKAIEEVKKDFGDSTADTDDDEVEENPLLTSENKQDDEVLLSKGDYDITVPSLKNNDVLEQMKKFDEEPETEVESTPEPTTLEDNSISDTVPDDYPDLDTTDLDTTDLDTTETLEINNENFDTTEDTSQTQSEDDIAKETQSYQSQIPRGQIDPFLTVSADIFENNSIASLPVFDEYTREQMRPAIIKAENIVTQARDSAIHAIYQIVKEQKYDLESRFEAKFKDSIESHDLTIKQLETNLKEKLTAKETKANEEYKIAQDRYVADQETRIRNEYDAQNKEAFDKKLASDLDKIKAQGNHDIEAETDNFNAHKNKESFKFITSRLRQMNFDTIFEEYNRIVSEQADKLAQDAVAFKDQLGVLTADLAKERDDLKQQLDDTHKEAESLRNENEKLRADWDRSLNAEARRQAQELSIAERQEKEDALTRSSENLAKSQEVIDTLRKALETSQHENELLKEKYEASSQANSRKILSAPTQEQTKKNSVIGIVVSSVLGVVAIIGLGFGVFAIVNHNSQTPATINATSSSVSQQTTSSTIKERTTYSSGDKWTYTKDGKKYEVTMDSPTTGSYTDDEGNTHKITLDNN